MFPWLSVQTNAVSGTVWPQFVMYVLTRGREPPVLGRDGIGRRFLEMGPMSSPLVTSYRLPIVAIGLSITVFAVLRLVIDGQTALV